MTKDEIVEQVRKDLLDRSKVGIKKYGVTLDREDLSIRDWLQHTYEETLDSANYLKKIMIMIDEEENCTKECTCEGEGCKCNN